MSSNLGYNQAGNSTASRRSQALAQRNSEIVPVAGIAPWQGYTPDIDVGHIGLNANRLVENLIPKADSTGLGEILGSFPGFTHVDAAYTTSGATPKALGEDAGSSQHIVGLFKVVRTAGTSAGGGHSGEFDVTTIAITAGDETADSTEVWRVKPSTGLWDEIAETSPQAGSSLALLGKYPTGAAGETVQLFDYAVLPTSGSPRTSLTAATAGEPTLVFTNNHDNVKMYAVGGESGTYEDLTEAFGSGASGFKARSVEAWGDRLNFLNTEESGVRHRQRLRRTAIGNPDPDATNAGSGAVDFQDFQGDGLRVEGIGSFLACYFEDGVAFVQRTFQSSSPYINRTITNTRGLLSTHSLANLGDGRHFGIYTDGWFILDESGEFQELGLVNIEGTPTNKWRETFYNRLDVDQRARIDCVYDPVNQWVHITLPLDGAGDNEEVWVYDVQGDRVFIRTIPVTKFGTTNIVIKSALTIGPAGAAGSMGGIGDLTIGELEGSIGSFGAAFGLETVIHGTNNGLVFKQDPSITSIIDINSSAAIEPSWKYTTIITGLGSSRTHKVVREVAVEHIKSNTTNFTARVFSNTGSLSETQTFLNSTGSIGDVKTLTRGFRYSAPQMSLELSGVSPFKLRGFEVDLLDTGSRVRI